MDNLRQDLRFALRALVNRPGFTLVALATLALGIGAATATFTVVDAVIVRPLAFEDSERLVTVWQTFPAWREQEILREFWREIPFSYPEYQDWRTTQTSFEDVAIFGGFTTTMIGLDEPVRISFGQATSSLFPLLRVKPVLGRLFTSEDEQPGAERTTLITHGLWQNYFGADRNVIGKSITIDSGPTPASFTIIGVLPADFLFAQQMTSARGRQPELWTVLGDRSAQEQRDNHSWEAIARLKPSVSLETAARETELIVRRSPHKPDHGAYVLSRLEQETGKAARSLLILFAAAGLVLVIACGNVGNLILGQAVMRQQEIAVRAALGAGKARIVRQLLTESLLLSIAASALGLVIAYAAVDGLVLAAPENIPRLDEINVDARILGFVVVVAITTALFFGLAPALALARKNLNDTLKEGGKARGSERSRLQGLIISAEIALSFVLLVGAALLAESLLRLSSVDAGLLSNNVLTVQITLPASRYPDEPRNAAFFNEAITALESLPGVESVSGISLLPFGGGGTSNSLDIEGWVVEPGQPRPEGQRRYIFPRYFETVRTRLMSGRYFTTADTASSDVMIVNETMAKRFWPDQDALGKRVRFNNRWHSVVGVVANVKDRGLGLDTLTTFFLPMAGNRASATLVIRTANDPLRSAPAVRSAIRAIDKDLAAGRIATMDSLVEQSMSQERYRTLLIAIFASSAGLLAAIGLYGVMSRAVARRTYELGIRMALGAAPRDVMTLVFRRSLLLTAGGVAVGFAVALASSRALSSLLFGIPPIYPPVYATIVILQFGVALAATYLPARRAARVDPVIALRTE